jgi:hypothetical protein
MKFIVTILILTLSSIVLFAGLTNDTIVLAKDTIKLDNKIMIIINTDMLNRFNNVHEFDTTITFQFIIDYIHKYSFDQWRNFYINQPMKKEK